MTSLQMPNLTEMQICVDLGVCVLNQAACIWLTRLPIPSSKAASRTSCSKASSKETGRSKELLSAEENVLGEENLHDLQHSRRGNKIANSITQSSNSHLVQ